MRSALLATLLLACFGCDKPEGNMATGKAVPPKPPPSQALPTTGNPKIRATRESLAKEIEQAEKDLDEAKKPPEHLLYGWKQEVDYLIVAATRAIARRSMCKRSCIRPGSLCPIARSGRSGTMYVCQAPAVQAMGNTKPICFACSVRSTSTPSRIASSRP